MGKTQANQLNLTVINRISEVMISEVVENKNTVVYSVSSTNEQAPHLVTFSVSRGKESDENYSGASVLSGSYQNGSVHIATQITETEDYTLLMHIHETMKKIANKEITF